MPDYTNGYILTGKGRALQAKAEAGAELKLTRMALGNGTTDSIDEYEEADRLKNKLYSMIISETEQVDKRCTCKASIRSEAVEQQRFYISWLMTAILLMCRGKMKESR